MASKISLIYRFENDLDTLIFLAAIDTSSPSITIDSLPLVQIYDSSFIFPIHVFDNIKTVKSISYSFSYGDSLNPPYSNYPTRRQQFLTLADTCAGSGRFCGEDGIPIDFNDWVQRYGVSVRIRVTDYANFTDTLIHLSIKADSVFFFAERGNDLLFADGVWNCFTIPLSFPEKSLNSQVSAILPDLGSGAGTDYRMFKWWSHDWLEYLPTDLSGSLFDSNFYLEHGEAYWLKTRLINPAIKVGTGATVRFKGDAYERVLDSGWNDIGTPYNYEIMFDDLFRYTIMMDSTQGDTDFSFFGFEEGYYPLDTGLALELDPFEGLAVFAFKPGLVVRIPPIAKRISSANFRVASKSYTWRKRRKPDPLKWRLNVLLTVKGDTVDFYNQLGVNPDAEDLFDRKYDRMDPPSPVKAGISFLGRKHLRLSRDIKKEIGSGQLWKAGIWRGTGESVAIGIDGLSYIPKELSVYYVDIKGNEMINMRETDVVPILFGENQLYKPIQIAIGDSAFIMSLWNRMVPRQFGMSQNMPNPFNPITRIKYQLPEVKGQGKMKVQIELYNVRGQLVRRLVNGERNPGYYQVIWRGRDDGLRPVASGVYFYRIKVINRHNKVIFGKQKKMILLK